MASKVYDPDGIPDNGDEYRIVNGKKVYLKGKKKMARKPKLGSGKRFSALEHSLASRPGVTNPGALAAYIGRKKYGNSKFQSLSAKGRARHRGK